MNFGICRHELGGRNMHLQMAKINPTYHTCKWNGKILSSPPPPPPDLGHRRLQELCPAPMDTTTRCGRCDFNMTSRARTVVGEPHSPTEQASLEEVCSPAEDTIYAGSGNTFSFTGKSTRAARPGRVGVRACWNADARHADITPVPNLVSVTSITRTGQPVTRSLKA